MKILLTGATGFIGNHFIQYAISHQMITFSFQNDDINTLDLSDCDAVVHLAALVHQMNCADSEEYEQINLIKTLELAQKAKRAEIKQFIFMSTVKVYGEESDIAYTEATPCHPQDDYGKSKFHAEQELQKLNDTYFKVSIIRTPVVYGAGVKGNIRNLINLIQKIPILPFGNIQNQRSMVYVGNLCALIECVLEHHADGIFLACDDTPLSTSSFIKMIALALRKKLYLIQLPLFETALRFFRPSLHQRLFGNLIVDNTLTKKRLNFHNPFSTEEGINNMTQGNQK